MRKGGASGRELSTQDLDTLQSRTFTGKEKKSLAYVIAIMNMILPGIEAPNIIHANTLTENLSDVQERDRLDVILQPREPRRGIPVLHLRRLACFQR